MTESLTEHVDTPRFPVPKGACDCHFHLYGPVDKYPHRSGRAHLQPDALATDLHTMHKRIGIERMILVHPGGYYADNQRLYDFLAETAPQSRGVAIFDPDISDAEFDRLDAVGVRGMRITPGNHPADIDDVIATTTKLAKRFAPRGWHLQFVLQGHLRNEIFPLLADLPVNVVIDHLGLIRPERREGHPGWEGLLKLVENENIWVKTSGADRITRNGRFEDALPVMKALIRAAPKRMVWGTDWPHVNDRPPKADGSNPIVVPYLDVDETRLINVLAMACPDAETFSSILANNPARLYGFESMS
ncbi:amidohydrolase family protein [Thermodesulfobacteriota bacterium]